MNNDFINTTKDGEITGSNPDADGDFYLSPDKNIDHNYWQEKIARALIYMSSAVDKDYFILYGGIVSDGGGGTINVSAGAAIGKDSDGNLKLVEMPVLTGVTLPAGWNDDRQIWVIGEYESKLGVPTRQHFNGETYHYTLTDVYKGESVSDDLFVDADPNSPEVIVCWGSFQMSAGNVFIDLSSSEQSRTLNIAPQDYVIANQADFENAIENVSGTIYKFKDNIKSIYMKSGDYLPHFITSDADFFLQTNNCALIYCEPDARILFNDSTGTGTVIGRLEINTENCRINNLILESSNAGQTNNDGTGSAAFKQSFFWLHADNVGLTGCRGTRGNQGFRAGDGTTNNETDIHRTMFLIGCKATYNDNGIYYCYQVSNSNTNNNSSTGFITSRNISSCFSDNDVRGFQSCYQLSACTSINNDYAFIESFRLAVCFGTLSIYGFYSCSRLSGCQAYNNSITGYYNCQSLSACLGNVNTTSNFSFCTLLDANSCNIGDPGSGGTGNSNIRMGALEDGTPLYGKWLSAAIASGGTQAQMAHGVSNAYTNQRIVGVTTHFDPGSNISQNSRPGAPGYPGYSQYNNTNISVFRDFTGVAATAYIFIIYK